jgi:sec-independent protein translocase protein TatB
MFDVGFSELLIIAVVALLVLGPERLPKAARFAGLWVRKARAQWYSVKSELELELAQDEMKKHLQETENSIKAPLQELQHELQQTETEISRDFEHVADALKAEPVFESETSSPQAAAPAEAVHEESHSALGEAAEQSTAQQASADDEGLQENAPKQGALW